MQTISRRKVAEYVADQLHAGAATKPLARQLAAYVTAQKQNVDLLMSDIESALSARFGVSTVRIATAHGVTAELRQALTDFVRHTEKAKDIVIAEEMTDSELIGGATVSTPNGFFDGSVRYQLQQLKNLKMNKEKGE